MHKVGGHTNMWINAYSLQLLQFTIIIGYHAQRISVLMILDKLRLDSST